MTTQTEQVLAKLPGTLAALQRADELWRSLREGTLPVPSVVTVAPSAAVSETGASPDWDVVICGGTLGILLGATLVQRGWRVALLERGTLRGRDQEWNISRRELDVFVQMGLLTAAELQRAIATEYNPARVQFHDGPAVWVKDVLNIGVDPVYLLETLKQKFLAGGGHLFEQTAFGGAVVQPWGVTVQAGEQTFTTRLLLDAMGHFSPMVQQARAGQPPDAVCLVVGSCATGFPNNDTGDLMVSLTPMQQQCQYFWEAFPARDGRTTYLFTYLDAHPQRLSLADLFEDYLTLLPRYQSVELDQLQFKRALFGFFPCHQNSPVALPWNRILPVGDSSGGQSPLSFGGFGAMVRHLQRLTAGIDEALQQDVLDRSALHLLQPYQPNLAVTWLFQRAMSVGMEQRVAPEQINRLLATVFGDMEQLGDRVLRPFLQDVVQFPALFQTLMRTAILHPAIVLKVLPQVGVATVVAWLGHYITLMGYAALYPFSGTVEPLFRGLSPRQRYYYRRWRDALKYGSGNDYEPE
jgi:lycopene cyclase CruP